MSGSSSLKPSPAVAGMEMYRVPRANLEMDLYLDANEGNPPLQAPLDYLSGRGPDLVRRYPDSARLRQLIADHHGLDVERVLLTNGSNDALDRACRAVLAPGRTAVLPVPTFEMLSRYVLLAGAEAVEVEWLDRPFPIDSVLAAVGSRTSALFAVTPNNPTGTTIPFQLLVQMSEACPGALLIVDLAYVEFADTDPTALLLERPNVLVTRTCSKARGLAGLRLGYALGPAEVIRWMRLAGQNYPVSSLSLAVAEEQLGEDGNGLREFVARVRSERNVLLEELKRLGADPWPSEANFVLARFSDASAAHLGLAEAGISVRAFPTRPGLQDCLRITCPGDDAHFGRLLTALEGVCSTQKESSK
jgi:histidinol-phosphate aminotransferase